MELIATGNTAEIFDYGSGKVLKLFKKGYPKESVEREFKNSKMVNECGIASPETFELLYDVQDGRDGIVYERVFGRDLLQLAFAGFSDADKLIQLFTKFSEIHKDFISHKGEDCISYKEYLKYFGYENTEKLPDGDYLCHGDFHPANLIEKENSELCVIDFMNLCRGPKEYDIARSYVLITEDNLGNSLSIEEKTFLMQKKAELGQFYLQQMGYTLDNIKEFIPAVEFCRSKEML